MYQITLISLIWDLSIYMNNVKITWTETIWDYSKIENVFIYFLNKDNSFNIPFICLKCSVCVDEA